MVVALQLLIVWTWFWPARWWQRLRQLPAIGYQGAADFVRSLIAFSLSTWLVLGVFALVFLVYGRRQPPAVIAVPVLAPFLLWASVIFFGYPRFIVPPGARDDIDVHEVHSLSEHPLFWLGFFIGLFALIVFILSTTVHSG